MSPEELQNLFCIKIGIELERFKRRMLKRKPEDIYQHAYQIDMVINIYELLMEQSRRMEKQMLQALLVVPNLLGYFYREWLKYKDSTSDELQKCVTENAEELCMDFPVSYKREETAA